MGASVLPQLLLLLPLLLVGTMAGPEYHNQFAVAVSGGQEVAEEVAASHGLVFLGPVGNLEGHFLLESPHLEKRSAQPCGDTKAKLEADPKILWFEQQITLTRRKRGEL